MAYYTLHIAFYGGILLNFHKGKHFKGASTFKYLLPAVANEYIIHPSPELHATCTINDHNIVCGEQFIMAIKAYLFKCLYITMANEEVDGSVISGKNSNNTEEI
jgi:hypothetical protein